MLHPAPPAVSAQPVLPEPILPQPVLTRPVVTHPILASTPLPALSVLRFWWVPVLFFATVFAWLWIQDYLDGWHARACLLEHFGRSFIREFERPLRQQPGGKAAVQSQLRLLPRRNRLEVLLAPQQGWHYPNLADHRRNVEYDIERIIMLLGMRRMACGPLAARGPWVVIPFRFDEHRKKEARA